MLLLLIILHISGSIRWWKKYRRIVATFSFTVKRQSKGTRNIFFIKAYELHLNTRSHRSTYGCGWIIARCGLSILDICFFKCLRCALVSGAISIANIELNNIFTRIRWPWNETENAETCGGVNTKSGGQSTTLWAGICGLIDNFFPIQSTKDSQKVAWWSSLLSFMLSYMKMSSTHFEFYENLAVLSSKARSTCLASGLRHP